MIEKIIEISITVAFTVAGTVVASWLAERGVRSRNRQLYGVWQSSWQPNPGDASWVDEIVDIQFNRRSLWFNLAKYRQRLCLINSQNTGGYLWKGYADVIHGRYIIGVWHSLKRASHSQGVFDFAIHPQGRYLYGYWLGPSDQDRTVAGAFVMGRTPDDIAAAKRHLWNCRIRVPHA